jgi:PTH2 family peptidyl-tRNA hydrolase
MKEPKQVIILRTDLNMSKGKAIAQGAHASLQAALHGKTTTSIDDSPDLMCVELTIELNKWFSGSHVKIVLGVDSEEELLDIFGKAQDAQLPRSIIKDEGRTELTGQNYTAVAIGPADPKEINKIAGHLKLL